MTPQSSPRQAGSITGLLVFALVAGLLAAGLLTRLVDDSEPSSVTLDSSGGSSATRRPAPDFTLPDPGGNPLSLSEWRGRPMLINFWATWCGPCEIEMPTIQAAYEKHQTDGLVVLAVAVEDNAADVQRFFERYGLTFQPLLDDGATARSYAVFGLPTSFFVDAEGQIVATHTGVLTERALEDYLAQTMTNDE